MTDQKISQLSKLALSGAELMEVAIAGTGNYQTTVNSVRGIGVGKTMSSAYTASITDPTTMTFKLQRMLRPEFQPIATNLQTFLDSAQQDFGYYTRSGNLGTFSFANGLLSVSSTSDAFGNDQYIFSREVFEAVSIGAAVEGITPSTDSGVGVIGVGLSDASLNNAVYMFVEQGSGSSNRVNLAQFSGGVFSTLASTTNNSLPAGYTGAGYTIEGTTAIAWLQVNGNAWVPVLEATVTAPLVLANLHPFVQVTGGTTTPWKMARIRSGYSGSGTAFRDFRVVYNKDGTPYVSDGFMYFTATNSLCAIWRMNVKSGRFEKTGILTFNRSSSVVNDLNAHIVWDGDANVWRVTWATWANGLGANVKIYGGTYNGDLLNGVHTVTGAQLNVTQQTSNAVYDQCLVWDAANSRWLLAYAYSPGGSFGGNMLIALDQSADLSTWTNVWNDTSHSGYEGAWIGKIGGNFFVFAGNGSNYRCWNTTSATSLGTMGVDVFPPTSGNPPPHFILFPWMDGDTTQYYALSWSNVQTAFSSGVFTTGTPMLFKATQTEVGFQSNAGGIR